MTTSTVPINAAHFVKAPSSELSETMANPASFKILYFPMMGAGATSRDLLAYSGFEYESIYPPNWNDDKPNTPMGCLPILYITGKNEKQVILTEGAIIEQYLAKQFHLLGDNEYEETLIKMFHNSASTYQTVFAISVTWVDPLVSKKAFEYFKTQSFPGMCANLEKHLVDNGSNGHFVGDKLSLADIRVSNMIEHFAVQPQAEELSAIMKQYPNLYKLRESVATHPKLSEWRKSKEWTKLQADTTAFFVNPFAAIQG
ncbi:hypothetical protein BG004_004329 [Podila humilis]|nr:hypothetical protein BG004_004329 [Podila humilis]